MSFRQLSLAIITKNRPQVLRECLLSILNQTNKPSELLIIDSSTNTRTQQLVKTLKFPKDVSVRYLYEDRRGYDIARNKALAEATGEWLGFTDDDCLLDPQWVEMMEKHIIKRHKVDVYIGKSITAFPFNPFSLVTSFFETYWKVSGMKGNTVIDYEILDTKNIIYRIGFLRKHGLIFRCERTHDRFWTTDDIDMGMQIQKAKGIASFVSDAIVYHKDPNNVYDFFRKIGIDSIAYGYYAAKWKKLRGKIQTQKSLVTEATSFNHFIKELHIPALLEFECRILLFFSHQFIKLIPVYCKLKGYE
jgi:glycosyltransferase involved in cell wall biosynthesis